MPPPPPIPDWIVRAAGWLELAVALVVAICIAVYAVTLVQWIQTRWPGHYPTAPTPPFYGRGGQLWEYMRRRTR